MARRVFWTHRWALVVACGLARKTGRRHKVRMLRPTDHVLLAGVIEGPRFEVVEVDQAHTTAEQWDRYGVPA